MSRTRLKTQPIAIFTCAGTAALAALRHARELTALQVAVELLDPADYATVMPKIVDPLLDQVEALAIANRKVSGLVEQLTTLKTQMGDALHSGENLAYLTADNVERETGLERIDRIAWLACARYILALDPTWIPYAVKEVSSHVGGWRALEAFRDAIDREAIGK